MPKIFVSYRRMDSEERAQRIADWLVNKYGFDNVFIDVDRIGGGADFIKAIEDSLDQTDVLLVIIGKKWVDELTRRSTLPDVDFVRLEVRTGLEKIPLVIPVLTDKSIEIRPNQLPDDIRTLTRRNFRSARGGQDFHRDMDIIKDTIDDFFTPQSDPEPDLTPSNRNIPFIPIIAIIGILGAIILFMIITNQNAGAGAELTQIASESSATVEPTFTDEPTTEPTNTDEPTLAPSDTAEPTATRTSSPTPTNTPDIAADAQTLVAVQTAQKFIEDATATSQQKTVEAQQTQTQKAIETATATVWTKTPTPDFTASVEALLTQWADGTLTKQAIDATATATLWTATPTATFTPSNTPTPTPTLSPEQIAMTPVTQNAEWTPIEHDFEDVTMVLVPVGCFMMGSDERSDEQPIHEQCFDAPFWIDKYEVTNRLYGSTGCTGTSSQPNQPRNCVSWVDAKAFCESRQSYLPSEKEWEYVARGPDNLNFPWGNYWQDENAVFSGNSNAQTAEVGHQPNGISWVGAMDMSGNVWEWVNSINQDYPYNDIDSSNDDATILRMLRGGAWFNTSETFLRASNRFSKHIDDRVDDVGFRCARDIDS
jgi:formylglycine-generating enzyme required for sulfatase activity